MHISSVLVSQEEVDHTGDNMEAITSFMELKMMLVERAEAGAGDMEYSLNIVLCKSTYTGPPLFTGHLLVASRFYRVFKTNMFIKHACSLSQACHCGQCVRIIERIRPCITTSFTD